MIDGTKRMKRQRQREKDETFFWSNFDSKTSYFRSCFHIQKNVVFFIDIERMKRIFDPIIT